MCKYKKNGSWTRSIGIKVGGADEDRTRDLLHAMEALSQLSYSPNFLLKCSNSSGVYSKATC